jgi:aryl-alcohol dehydrogenase-like predicted oxidoreductase
VIAPHWLHPRALRKDLEGSLRRLGADEIDLYLLHRDDRKTPLEEFAASMVRFRSEGKVVRWGVSNWTHERWEELLAVSKEAGFPCSVSSPQLSIFSWEGRPPLAGHRRPRQ